MAPTEKTLHHIPAGHGFANALVRGVMARVSSSEDMADSLLLLPNRRLARSVRLAFLRHSQGHALVLPRMLPIGDVEEDAIELAEAGWDSGDLPPVINTLERQLHLARQLSDDSVPIADTLALARSLADFLDTAQANDCDFSALEDLAQGDHAEHWQKVLKLLDLLRQWWPMKLENLGKSDPVVWRDAAIIARAKAWQENPPKGLVVIAGSTGSVTATRQLMKSVLGLKRGFVVLPGIDTGMTDQDWNTLDENDDTAICHPQYQLRKLLLELDCHRKDMQHWCDDLVNTPESPRISLLREAMRPAGQTSLWQSIPDRGTVTRDGFKGLNRIDCLDRREEAEVIALAMREALEVPDKTAALVTADRVLAETVTATLARWDVHVQDSAGTRLVDTMPAQFIRLIATAWANDMRPISLLGLLQHRLAAAGMARPDFRRLVRRMDRELMRGHHRQFSLHTLLNNARKKGEDDLVDLLESKLIPILSPLEAIPKQGKTSMADLADILGGIAENLAATTEDPLAIWQGQDGIRVARFLEQLSAHGKLIALSGAEWPAALTVLLSHEVIYPDGIDHPRLSILGPVEARMQHADLVILGGMNEGTSPPQTPPDPWMSNAMRQAFGLPPAHWRVGLAAHDAWMAMATPEVLITRSVRQDGTPTEISRWLRRLDTVRDVAKIAWQQDTRLQQFARQMNRTDAPIKPVAPPAPKLNADLRPRQFSATGLDTLLRDPYGVYARKVLDLKALRPLEEPPSAADRGTVIHAALRDFVQQYPTGDLPDDALEKLIGYGKKAFAPFADDPWVSVFWWSQFEAIASWFVKTEADRRLNLEISHPEIKGEMQIEGLTGTFTLTAQADRIDVLGDGNICVVDYKTGSPPSGKAVREARSLQLRVEAVLASVGAFPNISAGRDIKRLEYWKLDGRSALAGKIFPIRFKPDDEMQADDPEPLTKLLFSFDRDDAEWRSEEEESKFSDYGHLARISEWSVLSSEDEE